MPKGAEITVEFSSLRTDDFDELGEASKDWDLSYAQLSPGSFKGGIDLVQIGTRQIVREFWGQKIRYQGTAPPEAFAFALPFYQKGATKWVGMPAHNDDIVLQAPNQEAHLISSENYFVLVFTVPQGEVKSIASSLSVAEDFCFDAHDVVSLTTRYAQFLRQSGNYIINTSQSASAQDKATLSRWSDQVVKLLIRQLVVTTEKRDNLVHTKNSTALVSQATELALSEESSRIGLVEICARLGVSLRTLHYAFQDAADISPATYLRTIRLNKVHKILLRSEPEEVLIKQAALDNGFYHFGHFASQYRAMFGCTPSQTLHSG